MSAVRWWDPGVPIDLLTSGGDPRLDQANRLIALHRTGAAALLTAAAVPLCDVETVVDALEMTAAAAQVEIAKADDGDPTAAANNAAGVLYQACVNKGVIPPVAAARVAKVYGVPVQMLGRYPALATDARTPELVLTDTADRVLFGWVSAATAAEPVAKAVETPDERRAAQADQPRVGGRYADRPGQGAVTETSIDGVPIAQWLAEQLAAPEVATPPEPAPSPERTQERIKAIGRIGRIQSVAKPAAGRVAAGRVATGRVAGAREALGRTATKLIAEAREHAARVNRPVPDPNTPYEPLAGGGEKITTPGVLVLPLDEWEKFQAAMPRGTPGERVFQIGALNEYVYSSPIARVDVAGSTAHKETIRYVADQIDQQPSRHGLPDAKVWELSAEQQHELDIAIAGNDRVLRDKLLNAYATERLREVRDDLGLDSRDFAVQRELGHVNWYLDADDEDTVVLVWRPPLEWGDYGTHRPTTVLAEVVIENGYGQTDHGTRYGQTSNVYDPTTHIATTDDPDPLMFYDRTRNAALYRITAQRVVDKVAPGQDVPNNPPDLSGKVTKAETPDKRRAAQTGQPRIGGRYAERPGDAAVTETTIDGMSINDWLTSQLAKPVVDDETVTGPPPSKPIGRIGRIGRIQSVTPAPAAGRLAAGRVAEGRTAEGRVAAARFAAARRDTKPGKGELALDDGSEYHLMSTATFKAKSEVPDELSHATLSWEAREWVNGVRPRGAEDVAVELFQRGLRDKSEREGEHWSDPLFTETYDVSAVDDNGNNLGHEEAINQLAADLHAKFAGTADLTALEISLARVYLNNTEHVRATVRGNLRQSPTYTLIRRGDIDPDAPMLLSWEGKRRTLNQGWIRNEVRQYWPQRGPGLPNPQSRNTVFWMVNPWVETWHAHSPDEYLRDT